jgi:hypothetical protein
MRWPAGFLQWREPKRAGALICWISVTGSTTQTPGICHRRCSIVLGGAGHMEVDRMPSMIT